MILGCVLSFLGVSAFLADSSSEETDTFQVDVQLETPYYTITVPRSWLGSCTIDTVDNSTGKWVQLFRPGDFGAEHLFSILLTDKEDYKVIADHDLIGELTDPTGTVYHVVVSYPTDVQFSREEQDSYREMFNEAESILQSIQPAEGCTYESYDKTIEANDPYMTEAIAEAL